MRPCSRLQSSRKSCSRWVHALRAVPGRLASWLAAGMRCATGGCAWVAAGRGTRGRQEALLQLLALMPGRT